MSFFEFPHTRTYDSDLGWLIKKMEELLNEYNSIMEWISDHEDDYEELLNRVNVLEHDINNFMFEIEARFDELEKDLITDLNKQLHDALNDIYAIVGRVEAEILALRTDLTKAIHDFHAFDDANREYLIEYIEARLQQFIQDIPDLTTVNVLNPVRGEITSIQIAIDDLYNIGRAGALTALEYDTMGLTASAYDALDLTALEYDTWGKILMEINGYYINPFHYMNSPFTGELVLLETVINELASLHKTDTLTASEYDAKDLTATYYDSLDLTAYQYDWNGKTLVA